MLESRSTRKENPVLRPFGRLGQSISGASIRSVRIRPGRERIFLLARSTRQPDQCARHPERLHRRPPVHDVDDTPGRPPTRHSGTSTKYGRRSGAGGNGLIHLIELGVWAIIGNYHV
jgi:hypothetical protein